MVNSGPEVLAAISAMGRDSQLEELERQRMGVRYFLNATLSYSDEPLFETSEESKSYKKAGVGAGLVFPIFGTWSKQKISEIEAEIRSVNAKYRPQIITLHNLTALRKAYVTLWAECEKTKMSERFLSTEPVVSKVLAERQQKGLLLPADRLEFMTSYDMARRDIAVSTLRKTQALQIIRLATGCLWPMPEYVDIPTLPDFHGLTADTATHPELLMRRETLRRYEKLLETKRSTDREGSFTIGMTADKDFPGEMGTGVYAAVNITEPVGTLKSKEDKVHSAAVEDLKAAQREELFMLIKIEGEAEEAVALAGYAVVNIRAQESRLAAMSEAVRERIIRHTSIAGDTFEQLQKSRYQYYRVALDMLDSEMIFMQTGADLLSYAYPGGRTFEPAERFRPISDNSRRARLLDPDWLVSYSSVPGGSGQIIPLTEKQQQEVGPSATASKTEKMTEIRPAAKITETREKLDIRDAEDASVKESIPTKTVPIKIDADNSGDTVLPDVASFQPKSVYIWDAAPFLAPETRQERLIELQREGFSHILLALDPAQIADLDVYYNRMKLEGLLSSAKMSGIRVDLLLGEPNWIYPEERAKLLDIVRKMSGFKFQGIHLDIEPDSLPAAQNRRPELLKELIETVREVKNITDLPLSISIHPRYLEGELGVISNNGLKQINLEYIAVMLYSTNPDAVVERVVQIMLMQPGLKISLAQSVEKDLPPEESYMSFGLERYKSCMMKISKRLINSGSFKGILIQSWEDYRRML
ncbi:MAG: hypothetical protein LLF78_04295 [Synergistaceae bacterium]|nr:hypothetical protein [Synergistaceae bacterium]